MIKVISLDIGGTLVKSNSNSKYNLISLSKILNIDYELVRNSYKSIFQKKKDNFNNLVNDFCNMLNIKPNESIKNFFLNKFSSSDGMIEKSDIEVIKQLKEKGYKIILFSNNCCLNNNTPISEILDIVDDVFYSYGLGYTKNEEKSYRLIEEKLKYEKSEFLHIGDDLKSDYFCPIQYGWNAIYYGETQDTNIKSIKSLKDLLNLL